MIATDASRERGDRDRLIAQYSYLCSRGARKFKRPGLDNADLQQVAAIGLIKACDRYDARLRTPFEAFAWLFVLGELMHHVRDHERLVRPPRRLRNLERRAQNAHDALVFELGREPSVDELAKRLDVARRDVEELHTYRERAVPQPLDGVHPHELGPYSYTLEEREDRIVLEAALARLTVTERTIVLALYGSGYSQMELADRLGYSRRHISRLHRAALKKMQPEWVSHTARRGTGTLASVS